VRVRFVPVKASFSGRNINKACYVHERFNKFWGFITHV